MAGFVVAERREKLESSSISPAHGQVVRKLLSCCNAGKDFPVAESVSHQVTSCSFFLLIELLTAIVLYNHFLFLNQVNPLYLLYSVFISRHKRLLLWHFSLWYVETKILKVEQN